ncbi:hypothetical protein [Dyadobacter fermentans]|uniref:Lipoprotein n=1 Tax=Dyadobacter fermentans (strain ATCC 700827 / DSM 18053 / CIP 107007 / KCTC 52180 / NS114) TaxID=471854 RepID=C6VYA0_DYAFD|nr:hypothetical protein [Dyadobacter fermentans]ACT91579.1 hypothetical protein Dfer_0309 [Dyadobacter fermentans DSM 18053]
MKKIILLAFMCVAAIACDKKQDSSPQPELSTTSVPYRQATTVSTAGSDLKVELKEVADSRCPVNANCVTLGSAKLTLTVSDASNQVDVNLEFKGDSKNNVQSFKLSGVEYVLRVSEVLPYPDLSQTPKLEDYKIGVSIERK